LPILLLPIAMLSNLAFQQRVLRLGLCL